MESGSSEEEAHTFGNSLKRRDPNRKTDFLLTQQQKAALCLPSMKKNHGLPSFLFSSIKESPSPLFSRITYGLPQFACPYNFFCSSQINTCSSKITDAFVFFKVKTYDLVITLFYSYAGDFFFFNVNRRFVQECLQRLSPNTQKSHIKAHVKSTKDHNRETKSIIKKKSKNYSRK